MAAMLRTVGAAAANGSALARMFYQGRCLARLVRGKQLNVSRIQSGFAQDSPTPAAALSRAPGQTLLEDAFDVCVRFGLPPCTRVVARKRAANRWLLCAAPAYPERRCQPKAPDDLARHLRSGRLVQALPGWGTPEAETHAVVPQRYQLLTRARTFVDFLGMSFCAGRVP